jgi:hypothetical protein
MPRFRDLQSTIDTCASLRAGCARFGRAGWRVTAHTSTPCAAELEASSRGAGERTRPSLSGAKSETWWVRTAMPFATHLHRATARDERGPFRAPGPPLARWSIAPAFDESRPIPSSGTSSRATPNFSRLGSGDPGRARDTSTRSVSLEAAPCVMPDYVSVIYTREREHEPTSSRSSLDPHHASAAGRESTTLFG